MRKQLIFSFTSVVMLAVLLSWLFALIAANINYAEVLNENARAQAALLAGQLARYYREYDSSWEALNEALDERMRLARIVIADEYPEGALAPMPAADPAVRPWLAGSQNIGDDLFGDDLFWLMVQIVSNAQRVIVLAPDRTIVVDADPSGAYLPVDSGQLDGGTPILIDAAGAGRDRDRVGAPPAAEPERIGTLVIAYTRGILAEGGGTFRNNMLIGLLAGAATSALLAIAFGIALSGRLVRPIQALTRATRRIRSGEWGTLVEVENPEEIAELGESFNAMSRHLADQRRLRGRLVDDIAHEINTPLTLMGLELQALKDGLQTPEEAADHLVEELGEIADLVLDLTFLAGDTTDRLLVMATVDMNTIAAAAVRRFEGSVSEGRSIVFEPAPAPAIVQASSDWAGRAIANLLSNAIRHTPTGGLVTVRVAQEPDAICVTVADTGEGIAPEHLPHVFEAFYRADPSRTRDLGGRGLGLSIVRQIMQGHEGSVSVASTPGRGSIFTLQFPRSGIPVKERGTE
jgi:signal transduction histidine kinase